LKKKGKKKRKRVYYMTTQLLLPIQDSSSTYYFENVSTVVPTPHSKFTTLEAPFHPLRVDNPTIIGNKASFYGYHDDYDDNVGQPDLPQFTNKLVATRINIDEVESANSVAITNTRQRPQSILYGPSTAFLGSEATAYALMESVATQKLGEEREKSRTELGRINLPQRPTSALIEMHQRDSAIRIIEKQIETEYGFNKRAEDEETNKITTEIVNVTRELYDALVNERQQLTLIEESPIDAQSKAVLSSTSLDELSDDIAALDRAQYINTRLVMDTIRSEYDTPQSIDRKKLDYDNDRAAMIESNKAKIFGNLSVLALASSTGESNTRNTTQRGIYFDIRYNNNGVQGEASQRNSTTVYLGTNVERVTVVRAYRAAASYRNKANVLYGTIEALKQRRRIVKQIVEAKAQASLVAHLPMPSDTTLLVDSNPILYQPIPTRIETANRIRSKDNTIAYDNEIDEREKNVEKRKAVAHKFNQTQLALSFNSIYPGRGNEKGTVVGAYWTMQMMQTPGQNVLLSKEVDQDSNSVIVDPDSVEMVETQWVDNINDGEGSQYYTDSQQKKRKLRTYTPNTTDNLEAENRRRAAIMLASHFKI
jgi:hypothetical protein